MHFHNRKHTTTLHCTLSTTTGLFGEGWGVSKSFTTLHSLHYNRLGVGGGENLKELYNTALSPLQQAWGGGGGGVRDSMKIRRPHSANKTFFSLFRKINGKIWNRLTCQTVSLLSRLLGYVLWFSCEFTLSGALGLNLNAPLAEFLRHSQQ